MDFRSKREQMEIVHACIKEAVEAGYEKQYEFAEQVGKSLGEVSVRLRRAVDSNGDVKTASADYIGILAMRPAAKDAFMRALAREWGYHVEPVRPLSDGEARAILASMLTTDAKRATERERGLLPGSLG